MKIKYFLYVISLVLIIELTLRVIGFGNPVIYKKTEDNFFPKENQKLRRFLGSEININSKGMRTNSNWNEKKDIKILFFGDSVTFGGSFVDNNDLFSENLCQLIENSVCGNYAVNGYHLNNMIKRINNVNNEIEFNKLIIFVSSSFKNNNSNFSDFPFYQKYNKVILKASTEIINHFLFKYKIVDNYHSKNKEKEIYENISQQKLKIKFLDLINNLKKEKEIFIFILPTLEDFEKKRYGYNFFDNIKIKDIMIINLFDDVEKLNYQNLYKNNAHLNKIGHREISKIIYKYVK